MFFKSSQEGRKVEADRLRMAEEGGSGLAIDEIYVNLTIGRDFFGGQGHTSPGLLNLKCEFLPIFVVFSQLCGV